jgi:hypothetical protein
MNITIILIITFIPIGWRSGIYRLPGCLEWLNVHASAKADELAQRLGLARGANTMEEVLTAIYLPVRADGLIEQFEGYFQRRDVALPSLSRVRFLPRCYLGLKAAVKHRS